MKLSAEHGSTLKRLEVDNFGSCCDEDNDDSKKGSIFDFAKRFAAANLRFPALERSELRADCEKLVLSKKTSLH